MFSLRQIFQPAPYQKTIEDPSTVKKNYSYWRVRILYSMFVGYAFYYFTRKSFTFAVPGMIEDLGLTKGEIGLLASIFSMTYGFSKFASGILGDKTNPRYLMSVGLIITGFLNIFFGLSSSLLFFALFWGMNGWFQGFGWPPCAKFLTHWYSHNERGSWWSIWNVSHNVGGFLIAWIVGVSIQFLGWRSGLYIPGFLCIFGGIFLINRLRDTPQSLGLPSIEAYRNDYSGGSKPTQKDEEATLSTKEILFEHVLKNRYIWLLAIAYFFIYVVRTGVNDWTSLFLVETKGYSRMGASGTTSLFEIGGFFGSLVAGWSSDYLFKARRGPVNTLFAAGCLITVSMFWLTPAGYPLMDSLAIFMIGFMVFGPQMLIGVAAAEFSHKKAAATATGFAGTFGYLGASFAGYPLGLISESYGWQGFFIALATSCVVSTLLLLPLWSVTPASLRKEEKSLLRRQSSLSKEMSHLKCEEKFL